MGGSVASFFAIGPFCLSNRRAREIPMDHQMDHQMDGMGQMAEMLGGGGTYIGHVLPGIGLALIALVWVIQDLRSDSSLDSSGPIQLGALIPWFKIVVPAAIIWQEIPGRGWYPMDIVMGWQHATIHATLVLSGVVDLMHRRGRLSGLATYNAFGGAMLVGGAIFAGHGNHDGMSTVAHLLLAALFMASGLLTLAEGWSRRALRPVRQAAVMATGTWLATIGWIIFGSGWDEMSMISTGWVWLTFCWNAMAVGLLFTIVALRKSARTAG